MAPYIVKRFPSLWDFVETCERNGPGTGEGTRYSPSQDWDMGVGWEGACKLAKEGWHDISVSVEAMTKEIRSRFAYATVDVRKPKRDVYGSRVNVGRYLTGDPKCMVHRPKVQSNTHGRVVRIVSAIGGAAGVPAKEVMMRGAAVIALTETLTLMGFAVEVIAEYSITNTHDGSNSLDPEIVAAITLKASDEVYDPDAISFGLAHPAMQRRLCFSWRDSPEVMAAGFSLRHGSGGCGARVYSEGDVILRRPMWNDRHNKDGWVAWIARTLSELNIANVEV